MNALGGGGRSRLKRLKNSLTQTLLSGRSYTRETPFAFSPAASLNHVHRQSRLLAIRYQTIPVDGACTIHKCYKIGKFLLYCVLLCFESVPCTLHLFHLYCSAPVSVQILGLLISILSLIYISHFF